MDNYTTENRDLLSTYFTMSQNGGKNLAILPLQCYFSLNVLRVIIFFLSDFISLNKNKSAHRIVKSFISTKYTICVKNYRHPVWDQD